MKNSTFKGLVLILLSITHPDVFSNLKTFVLLRNTNEDLFNEIWELSVLSIDSYTTTNLMLQKVHS